MPESPQPNFAGYHVRKWFTQIEDTHANETGALADGDPVRKIVVAAAIHNPYAGCFSEDLSLIVADSPKLG
ncbi:amino acid synthesis family protein, partial [Streptomyces griseiscabiei]